MTTSRVGFLAACLALGLSALPSPPAAGADAPAACEQVECPEGKSQSPIRLDASLASTLDRPMLSNQPAGVVLWNTGHSLQVEYSSSVVPAGEANNLLVLDGAVLSLLQFHLHRPAEHVWGDVRPDMELHLVHRDAAGSLAVVGLPIVVKDGAPDQPGFAQLLAQLPGDGERRYLPERFDLRTLTQSVQHSRSLRYPGSLTTPPCSEGVRWSLLDLDGALAISRAQYDRYAQAFPHPYCRALQPANGRVPLRIER